MLKKNIVLATSAFLILGTTGACATTEKKPVSSWTCEDFLMVEETLRPQVVSFTEGLTRKGKPENEVIDIEGISTVTPMVVEICTKNLKSSFKKELEATWKKAKTDVKKAF